MKRPVLLVVVLAVVLAAAELAVADPSGYLKPEGDPKTREKAARLFDEGTGYLERGSSAPALRAFRQAATLCPDFFEARYNVAKLEGEKGGRETAVAKLEALGRDFPANVRAFSDLGQLLVEDDPETAARAFDTAVANAEKLLEDETIKAAGKSTVAQLAVDAAFAYHNRGASRLGAGDLDGARADFARSVELNDANFFSHYGLGLVLLQQADFTGAKASFKRAKALKRSFADCSIGLARAYLGETPPKPTFAFAELKEVEALVGRTAQVEELYGDAFRLQKNFDAATERYGTALELGADRASIALKLGLVARGRGDHDAAKEFWGECIEHTDEARLRARAYQHLGELDEAEKDFEAAAAHFAKAVELDPEAGGARLHLGACLFQAGRYEEAEKQLAAAIEHYGDDPPEAVAEEVALARKLLDKIRSHTDNDTQTD